jgi:murein tripeptide amidase MpaA
VSYLNVDEVESALIALASANPSLVELITLPEQTVEGRTVHCLRIGKLPADQADGVFFTGGVHAREWGSCEILVNFATDLIDAYLGSTGLAFGGKSFTWDEIRSIMEGLNVYVFADVNPDGRHYSQTSDSGWRKNRNPAQSGGDPAKIGVDVNRNFDFLWDFPNKFAASAGVNTSTDPSSLVYRGPSAFSEVETRNVRWVLDSYPRIRWFIDLHSYGEDALYSWGDDQDQSTDTSMVFTNAAFDSVRGIANDAAYKEYIPAAELTAVTAITTRMHDAILAVRGKDYLPEQGYSLYPTSGASDDYSYSRHIVDGSKTRVYAWTIEWGDEFQPPWSEMQNIIGDICAGLFEFCLSGPCDGGSVQVTLETPSLTFNDVEAGTTASRAIVVSVRGCQATQIQVISGPTLLTGTGSFGVVSGTVQTVGGTDFAASELRIWVQYTGVNALDTATGTIRVRCTQTGDQWDIPILCNVIAAPTVAVALILDKSGSMDWDAGGGRTRIQVLHDSAPPFVEVAPQGSAVAVVSFDQAASQGLGITPLGPMSSTDPARMAVLQAIANHQTNPAGSTSIGNGVDLGHQLLAGAAGYQVKASIVLTDGQENTYKFISDVMPEIDEHVFAIGLGTVEEINPVALRALTAGTGGYLLMTGVLGSDDYFRLEKYYMQILAGVTNAAIVLDPDGWIAPGGDQKIPFHLTEADYGCDVILLSPSPGQIEMTLETPGGSTIGPASPLVSFMTGRGVSCYRMTLPVPVGGGAGARAGTWYARLRSRGQLAVEAAAAVRGAVRYSLTVHARSNLHLRATLGQDSQEIGATLTLRAVLTESGLPVARRAAVLADLERPDKSRTTLELKEVEPGAFEAQVAAAISGIYNFRVRASGKTLGGRDFTREQTLTGVAWKGGDAPLPGGQGPLGGFLCRLLRCLEAGCGKPTTRPI